MSVKNLNTRLNYHGGNAEGRFQRDKLNSLKRALLYSYQSETIELMDGRQFRCLINPDKLKPEYDNKVVSIPFEDICLNKNKVGTTTEGIETIGLKAGDYFIWKERTGHSSSTWLVYLQHLEEDAYFRGDIRRCDYTIDIDGHEYPVYVRGPVETDIPWNQKKGMVWNDLNYSLVMYISKNEETDSYFSRFTKIDFDNKKWEVQAVNRYDSGGKIIEVFLKETFSNAIEEEVKKEQQKQSKDENIDITVPRIVGEKLIYPYDIKTYTVEGISGGQWNVDNNKVKIIEQNDAMVTIEVITSKSGSFNLIYGEDLILNIEIGSL